MNTRFMITFLLGIFLLGGAIDADAQRRSSRSKKSSRSSERSSDRSSDRNRRSDDIALMDKLAFDIIFNPYFSGGINIALKAGAGYKVTDAFTAGLGTKLNYVFNNSQGNSDDFSRLGYGVYPFLRLKFAEAYYAKVEYNLYSTEALFTNGTKERFGMNFPMIGGGYVQGFGKWKFGMEIMLIVPDSPVDQFPGTETSDFHPLLDYNIAILYNF